MTAGITQKGSDQLPLGSVVTAGIAAPAALQGGSQTTDVNSVVVAPALIQLVDGYKATYSAAITAQVPATTAGDVFTLTWVSKIIRLTRIQVTGVATTAVTLDVTLVKRSTVDTAGTFTSPTIVAHDSANAAVTALVKTYTVAPTAGTLVGVLCSEKLLLPVSAGTNGDNQIEWIFGERPSQCPVLRAAGLYAVTISAIPSGGSMNISMEWTEE